MSADQHTLPESIADIKYVMYINLEHRNDRRTHIENELTTYAGIKCEPVRFNAIKNQFGAIGCSLSHIACLEQAKQYNLPYVMICEDDFKIINANVFQNSLNQVLRSNINWDVLLLAGNNAGSYRFLSRYAVQVCRCYTTTGYIVRNHYYDILIENFKRGVEHLLRQPNMGHKYAIDVYWQLLQEKDVWILLFPLTVTQVADYSDIEKKQVNYDRVMLTLDKSATRMRMI